MSNNSDSATLAKVAEIVMGQSPSGDTYNEAKEGMPLLNGPTEFGLSHPVPKLWTTQPTKLCRPGDLLFCVRGSTTGRMNWADQPYCIGRGVAAIRGKEGKLDTHFVYYNLASELPRLLSRCAGSVFSNLGQQDLATFDIPWPEQHMREAIASVLGALDDKIELNRRMNETLEALAQSLFKCWFIDATQNGLPQGWREGALGEVAENPRRGIQPNEIKLGTAYIALEHMPRRCIALSEWGTADSLESNKFEFKRGEILFGKLRPYFHKIGVSPVDGVCSTDILVIRPKDPKWFGFVLGYVSSVDLVNHTDAASTGTKMPRTNWKDIASFEVALPAESLAADFTQLIRPLVERITSNIHESRTLAALRDALLPKLLSGELRVPAATEIVEARA